MAGVEKVGGTAAVVVVVGSRSAAAAADVLAAAARTMGLRVASVRKLHGPGRRTRTRTRRVACPLRK